LIPQKLKIPPAFLITKLNIKPAAYRGPTAMKQNVAISAGPQAQPASGAQKTNVVDSTEELDSPSSCFCMAPPHGPAMTTGTAEKGVLYKTR
jgi:hypothetical protein